MAVMRRRNPLTGWLIGLAIIVAVELFAALHLQLTCSETRILAQLMVLIILPAVYLVLTYLTLKSKP